MLKTSSIRVWFARFLSVGATILLFSLAASAQKNSYLFVWTGDDDQKSADFLAVYDADPASSHYGQVVASVTTPGAPGMPHHTEMQMPPGGFLLANAFESGRTFLFDLRRPLKPKVVANFGNLAGYMHPHTYIRLPNGHILASFQYHGQSGHAGHEGHEAHAEGGGLVEFTEKGKVIRSGSAVNGAPKDELIRPYSLVALPQIDRIVSTNTAMHDKEGDSRTVQIWRLSDLKLLQTLIVPPGPRGNEQLNPGEPELLEDGKTVLIHTFSCGLYELSGIETVTPSLRHRYTFDAPECAVPVRIGKYWVQTLFSDHAVAAVDISDRDHIREVSRVVFDEAQKPHWMSADPNGTRLVMNSGEYGDHRLFILNFDPKTGQLVLDRHFQTPGQEKPGVTLEGQSWPHGFHGNAYPHGAVFSRP